ncbi:MAG: hypothetical protein WHX52_03040 [Anaerolineae bacterium]
MTIQAQSVGASAQFAQIFNRIKQLTVREQLTLAKMLLESVLDSEPETQDTWPVGFFETTAGMWAGEPLVREPQGVYETREFDRVPGLHVEDWALL